MRALRQAHVEAEARLAEESLHPPEPAP
jgi:hypothetical protein